MKPKPWSYTSLDDFVNCPKAFYEKRVAKSVQEEKSEQMIWGERVHKMFEDRQDSSTPLPPEVADHEPFMKQLEDLPGTHFTEQKIAFNKKLEPTHFFDREVWWRGIIDYKKIHKPVKDMATIVDYKTGKPHNKFKQLDLFALHTFALHPDVDYIEGSYYWTKTASLTTKVYRRDMIKPLWSQFIPDLKQYAEAFRTDTWQPRPSGLCNGWCPVKDCEFWKPKRVR